MFIQFFVKIYIFGLHCSLVLEIAACRHADLKHIIEEDKFIF